MQEKSEKNDKKVKNICVYGKKAVFLQPNFVCVYIRAGEEIKSAKDIKL